MLCFIALHFAAGGSQGPSNDVSPDEPSQSSKTSSDDQTNGGDEGNAELVVVF